MKTKQILLMLLIAIMINPINAQIRIDSYGKVRIGPYDGGPREKLDIDCDTYFSHRPANSGFYFSSYYTQPIIRPQLDNAAYIGMFSKKIYRIYTKYLHYDDLIPNSDLTIKENIRYIESPLSKICDIRGIMFDYKRDYYKYSPEDIIDSLMEESKNNFGFISQEIKEVIPELVYFNKESGLYGVNYVELIPILVEAIKEQQLIIDNLIYEVSEIKSGSSDNLKSDIITNDVNLSKQSDKPILFQNKPNPFDEDTEIRFYLPATVNDAGIYLYNMQGNQIKSIAINKRGQGSEIIHGLDLKPGMYMYTLIVNGLEVDTKRMILTD